MAVAPCSFDRAHHRRIARLLESLDAPTLAQHHCLFGGGTVIALKYGEYRESRDVDFIVSSVEGYRALRALVTTCGIKGLFAESVTPLREVRMDQYGIRTVIEVDGEPIKFEIVLEGRIPLDAPRPADAVCGVSCLTRDDLVAEKLLANSDRWADAAVHSRDLIDLAMMLGDGRIPPEAVAKASLAYSTIEEDLRKAQEHVSREGRLQTSMQAMQMTQPPALVLERIRKLRFTKPRGSKSEP